MRGVSIRERTGTSDLREAELILAKRVDEIRKALVFGVRPTVTFREAATRYLEENAHLSDLNNQAHFLKRLDPFIGELPLNQVHIEVLQPFIDQRKKEGVKNKTINGHLAVVRRILNLSSRLWRDDNGFTWLETAPLIQMLPTHDSRKPSPLSWEEQDLLLDALPEHLRKMCLFKLNTDTRHPTPGSRKWFGCSGTGTSRYRSSRLPYSRFRPTR